MPIPEAQPLPIEDTFAYDFDVGPEDVPVETLQPGDAINCQTFVHWRLGQRGIVLPPWLRSKELFEPNDFMTEVPVDGYDPSWYMGVGAEVNDIYFFAPRPETNPMYYHVALVAELIEGAPPRLEHATPLFEGVVNMSLADFQSYPQYRWLMGIRRPLVE